MTEFVQLEDVIESAQSGFASGARAADGVVQLRMNNVTTDGNLDWSSFIRVPATEKEIAKYSLEPGDVLFNATNSPNLVGKTAFFNGHTESVVFSNHFVRLRADLAQLEARYLARWLTYQWQRKTFESLCTQWVNQATVRKEDLLLLKIPLPPLSEQRRIAALLDKADKLRRTRRYAAQLSETFLQTVFVRMFGDARTNPMGWEFRQLGEISDIASGVTKGQNFNGRPTVVMPYLRVANVQDGYLDLSEIKMIEALASEAQSLILQKGDILMTEGGDYDKLGRGALWNGEIENCIHQNHIFRVRTNRDYILPNFFATFLLMPYAKNYFLKCSKQTSNLATINMTQLKELSVPLPPLAPQEKFARIVQQFERLRAQQREAERQAEHLFQTLLKRAFE